MVDSGHIHFLSFEQLALSSPSVRRTLTACALGGGTSVVSIERIFFTVTTTNKAPTRLLHELRVSDAIDQVGMFRHMEEE